MTLDDIGTEEVLDTVIAENVNPVSTNIQAYDTATEAVKMGYTGDPCPECGQFKLTPNGNCFKCWGCGATTGCS